MWTRFLAPWGPRAPRATCLLHGVYWDGEPNGCEGVLTTTLDDQRCWFPYEVPDGTYVEIYWEARLIASLRGCGNQEARSWTAVLLERQTRILSTTPLAPV